MATAQQPVSELEENFRGEVIRPGDDRYDAVRAVFNGMIDRRPAMIARCTGVADVASAVNFGRERDLVVAVRGGGHSVSGYGTCDEGLVIDLSPMKGIWVDPEARTARTEAGVTWGQFDRETQQFGLAVTGGRITTTGVGGLTLGSGSGWLERKFGLTVDNLLSAQVVTSAGEVVNASERENEDLFWAIRGGGGNFGIVTSFEYRLHQLGPIVWGGMLLFTRDKAPELLRAWRDHMLAAPDEVCSGFALLTAPPEPFIPEPLRGQPAAGIVVLYAGPLEDGEEAVEALKRLGEPDLDLVQPMPYTIVQTLLDAGNPPGRPQYWKSDHLRELSDEAVDTLVEHANKATTPLSIIVLEPKGGALGRLDDSIPLGHREVPFDFYGIAQWEDLGESDVHVAWAKELGDAMEPFVAPGISANFYSEQTHDRLVAVYGEEKYGRLVEIKRRYDPQNLFCTNQNIAP